MDENRIFYLLELLDGSDSSSECDAINELQNLGEMLPRFLMQKYKISKKWKARSVCVHNAIRYARNVPVAFELGVLALNDKAYVVRYKACVLLAYSLNDKALYFLEEAAAKTTHKSTFADIRAAIDAITHKNSDLFLDRKHTGKVHLIIH